MSPRGMRREWGVRQMPSSDRVRKALWLLSGGFVLASALCITLLSERFVYGEGHAERPIVLLVLVLAIGWVGYASASSLAVFRKSGCVWWILGVGLVARCFLLPSNLVQENDCYRYVLDGEATVHGVNAYDYAPQDVADEAPRRFSEALQRDDAHLILSRISYKHVPTIYPPLAQGAFAVGAFITPWNWHGQRYVFLAFDILTALVVLAGLRLLKKPDAWVVVYAWNPLILKEIANSAHLDSLAGCCLVALVVCLVRWDQGKRPILWATLAGLALAGAVLTKLYPLMLAPVCLAFLWRRKEHRRTALVFLGVLAVATVLAYLPFLNVGPARLTEGLRTYGREWQRNDGAFRLLATVFGGAGARGVAAGFATAWALAMTLRAGRSEATTEQLIAAMQATLLCWFLLLPAAYPWYAVGLLALAPFRPRPWAVVLSGSFALYYFIFLIDYRELPPGWKLVVQAVEHGLVWAALAATTVVAWTHTRRTVAS